MIKLIKYYLTLIPEIILVILWLGIQCFLFTDTFTDFRENPLFASTNALTGSGVAIAKASAAVINFNTALLIISMCRITLTLLKRFNHLPNLIPLEKFTEMHKFSAVSIIIFSAIHTIAHYINYSKIPSSWPKLAFLTGPGATGHILWFILIIISITSFIKRLRIRKFEIFWYCHFLAFFFIAVISFHGAFCFVKRDSNPECPGAKTWKWIVGPIGLFILEIGIKTFRINRFTFISKVVIHQVDVIEVQIKKPSLVFKPGQYIQLKCPNTSLFQWHPFTITSAPEEGFLSIHVRIVGDWTRKFAQRLGAELKENKIISYTPPEKLPNVLIDGPYGSMCENYDKFEVAICIGAGIGQTPFSSILKSMWYSITHPYIDLKLEKVIFVQISRELQSLSWFLDILKALERQNDVDNILEIYCYLTSKLSDKQAMYLHLLNEKIGKDPITGLDTRTKFGRPDFERLFNLWTERFDGKTIGVFYCGPKPLGKQLKWLCIKKSSQRTHFKYYQETF